jgi:hypothetical protein
LGDSNFCATVWIQSRVDGDSKDILNCNDALTKSKLAAYLLPSGIGPNPNKIAFERLVIGAWNTTIEARHILNGLDSSIRERYRTHLLQASVVTDGAEDSEVAVRSVSCIRPNVPNKN